MKQYLIILGLCILAAITFSCGREEEIPEDKPNPIAIIKTSLGDIKIELYRDKSPLSVENFLGYIQRNFYEGTIIHRVVPGFAIQGGGYDEELNAKQTFPPVQNESLQNELKNLRGTVGMARSRDPNSATSQFYINLADNQSLDPRGYVAGYTVFGAVISGMNVVDKIAELPTAFRRGHEDVPLNPPVIMSIELIYPDEKTGEDDDPIEN